MGELAAEDDSHAIDEFDATSLGRLARAFLSGPRFRFLSSDVVLLFVTGKGGMVSTKSKAEFA